MTNQADKATRFRALHQGPGAFLIANAWDAGSARILARLGFSALATSSGAQAGTLGRVDGKVTRDEALAHCRAIVAATDLPVSADLEKGFGDAPEVVAETIRLAAEAGLVGCSIEDASGNPDAPIFELSHATERIAAAAAAARALPFPFTLTGRTENFLRGRPDLDDTIKRLQAHQGSTPRRHADQTEQANGHHRHHQSQHHHYAKRDPLRLRPSITATLACSRRRRPSTHPIGMRNPN